ncbi:hypothetical protein BH23ACT10_BH23ACT10_09610 [soil metagenome]
MTDLAQARRTFWALTVLRWVPTGLYVPVFVLVMTDAGLSIPTVGLVTVAYGVTTTLLELPTGGLADRLGRRPVLVVSALLEATGLVLFAVAGSPWAFVAATCMLGVFRALDSGPLQAWFVDVAVAADPSYQAEDDLSRAGVVLSLTLAASGAVAGLVATGATNVALLGVPALSWPLLIGAVVAAVRALVTWRRIDEPARQGTVTNALTDTPRAIANGLRIVRRSTGVRWLLSTEAAWGFGVALVELLWQPRLGEMADLNNQAWLLGIFAALGWLANAAGAWSAPRLRARTGSTTAAAALMRLGQAGTVLVLGLAAGWPGLLVGYAVVYFGNGATAPLTTRCCTVRSSRPNAPRCCRSTRWPVRPAASPTGRSWRSHRSSASRLPGPSEVPSWSCRSRRSASPAATRGWRLRASQ